jgi:hypothetical protein
MCVARIVLFMLPLSCAAQSGWAPLSPEVVSPWAKAATAYGSTFHAAVQPYSQAELRALNAADTVPAAWKTLDGWAGRKLGAQQHLRGGPLLDATAGLDSRSGALIFRMGVGAWLQADLHPKFTLHADGQVWYTRPPEYLDTLVRATQVMPGEGLVNGSAARYSHHDRQYWASFSPSKAFNVTAGMGRNAFGHGYRSLLLSANTYAYSYLKLSTMVWRLKYVNLFAALNDPRGAQGRSADFTTKFTSMHYLSWNVGSRFALGLFEAVVWQNGTEAQPRGFDIHYLNPVIFYRPVEFSQGSADNALLGVALDVKVRKQGLIYAQLVLDEFLLREVRAGLGWFGNKQGLQLGWLAHDAFRVTGLMLRAEANLVRPFMYTHSDTRQNYAHLGQPLAHPYGSNFWEGLVQARWQRAHWVGSAVVSYARMGVEPADGPSYGNNIFRPESERPLRDGVRPESYNYYLGVPEEMGLWQGVLTLGRVLDPATGSRVQLSYQWRQEVSTEGAAQHHVLAVGIAQYFRNTDPLQQVRYRLE